MGHNSPTGGTPGMGKEGVAPKTTMQELPASNPERTVKGRVTETLPNRSKAVTQGQDCCNNRVPGHGPISWSRPLGGNSLQVQPQRLSVYSIRICWGLAGKRCAPPVLLEPFDAEQVKAQRERTGIPRDRKADLWGSNAPELRPSSTRLSEATHEAQTSRLLLEAATLRQITTSMSNGEI
jgi:hypothetical protein